MTTLDDRPAALEVVDGYVVTGKFAGATASREERWTCWKRPCFDADGWRIHHPDCQTEHETPVWPDRKPSGREQRLISAAEDGDVWVERCVPNDPIWRERHEAQRRVQAGGDAA